MIEDAVAAYVEKRRQMEPRHAATVVCQTFGVSAHDLSNAVAEAGQLLVQQPQRPRDGISTYRHHTNPGGT